MFVCLWKLQFSTPNECDLWKAYILGFSYVSTSCLISGNHSCSFPFSSSSSSCSSFSSSSLLMIECTLDTMVQSNKWWLIFRDWVWTYMPWLIARYPEFVTNSPAFQLKCKSNLFFTPVLFKLWHRVAKVRLPGRRLTPGILILYRTFWRTTREYGTVWVALL